MKTKYDDKKTHSGQEEQMKEQAEGFKEDTFHTGEKYADQGKNTAADIATDFADALQSAAGELDGKNRNTSAEYVRIASENIRKVSHSLRQKSVNQILNQASSYGRRQPVLFLGGAMLAGYALTRLIKSANDEYEEDQWLETMHPAEGRTTAQPGTRRTSQATDPTSPAGSGTTPPSGTVREPGHPSPGTLHSTLDGGPGNI
ncbi:MAG: hypothetical protein WBB23_09740 [Desulforhopalus sp.]